MAADTWGVFAVTYHKQFVNNCGYDSSDSIPMLARLLCYVYMYMYWDLHLANNEGSNHCSLYRLSSYHQELMSAAKERSTAHIGLLRHRLSLARHPVKKSYRMDKMY